MTKHVGEHLGAFRCPKCGNDGLWGPLRYLEDITCYREILGVKNGELQIDGLYHTDGYDEGRNMRFECRALFVRDDGTYFECEHEWDVKAWIAFSIDWV